MTIEKASQSNLKITKKINVSLLKEFESKLNMKRNVIQIKSVLKGLTKTKLQKVEFCLCFIMKQLKVEAAVKEKKHDSSAGFINSYMKFKKKGQRMCLFEREGYMYRDSSIH